LRGGQQNVSKFWTERPSKLERNLHLALPLSYRWAKLAVASLKFWNDE
jgi:hypothetical protein